jgi:GxxExxY protein
MERDPLTYAVIGCAMKVHTKLGPGFQEVIYQRSLAIELEREGISFVRELSHPVYYDGIVVGDRRADFVIAEKLCLELKALAELNDVHLAQAKNYVVVYDYPRGLLINFGGKSLTYKLLFNPKYNYQ